jgi:hypothetical protein
VCTVEVYVRSGLRVRIRVRVGRRGRVKVGEGGEVRWCCSTACL